MKADFPPMSRLLPQSGPMRLLDRVLAHDARGTRCAVDPAQSGLFEQEPGRVPAWIALEYMAQCAAVDGALRARGQGEAPAPALFAGSRRLVLHCDTFATDAALEVDARPAGTGAGAVAFDCRVVAAGRRDALVEGRLLVALLRRAPGAEW